MLKTPLNVFFDAVCDRRFWGVTEQPAGLGNVSISLGHVARLLGEWLDNGFFSGGRFDHGD